MSERESVDAQLQSPATLEAVVAAIVRASAFDEAELQELVSAGKLRDIFPYRPHATAIPSDFVSREDLVKASAIPLDQRGRKAIIQSSMPRRSPSTSLDRSSYDQIAEFAVEWQKADTTQQDAAESAVASGSLSARSKELKSHE